MADLTLSKIPSEIVRSVVLQTIEDELQTKDFQFHVSSASKAGENNFVGVIYRVSCSRNDDRDGKENSAKNIIIKIAPQNLLRRSQFVVRAAFTREIQFYEKVTIESLINQQKTKLKVSILDFAGSKRI